MNRSAWAITATLMTLALTLAWFLGLDARHAVVLVAGAFAAGIANALLDSLDLQRPVLTPIITPARGLAEVQALEFSLAANEPGTRAVLEVHELGRSITRTRPEAHPTAALAAFLRDAHPRFLTHRELADFLAELVRIVDTVDPSDTARRRSDGREGHQDAGDRS